MAWDPKVYNKFKQERSAPFEDLAALIKISEGLRVIDLGCGTGELTARLAGMLPKAEVLGIDSSAEMLKESEKFTAPNLRFEQSTIESQINDTQKFDFIFSNAALQWVDDHEKLIPQIISILKPGGQIIIQMPSQHHNTLNIIIEQLISTPPFSHQLNHWKRPSPVLSMDRYAQILFENGSKSMTLFEKMYPVIVQDVDALYNWVAGTTILPYLERLDDTGKEELVSAFRKEAQKHFNTTPILYPFKRILIGADF
ncbi:MAG: methyltransferase domain-containing protein [Agriterribacter sp.]